VLADDEDFNPRRFRTSSHCVPGGDASDLGKSGYRLFADSVLHPITVFQRDDAPVATGILGSMMSTGRRSLLSL